jgi:hypothetical protein
MGSHSEPGGEGRDWLNWQDADQAGWGRLARVVESPASGPRNPGKTRSDSRR